eukprot:5626292-Pleurochrysis_carterae.AAC.1
MQRQHDTSKAEMKDMARPCRMTRYQIMLTAMQKAHRFRINAAQDLMHTPCNAIPNACGVYYSPKVDRYVSTGGFIWLIITHSVLAKRRATKSAGVQKRTIAHDGVDQAWIGADGGRACESRQHHPKC